MEEENLFEYEGVSYPESSLREIYPEDFDKYVEQGVLTKVGGEEPVDVVDTQEESLYEYEGVSYPESSLREAYPDTFDDYVEQGVLTKVDSLGKPIAVEDSAAARDMDLVSEDGSLEFPREAKKPKYLIDGKEVNRAYLNDNLYKSDFVDKLQEGTVDVEVFNDPKLEELLKRQAESGSQWGDKIEAFNSGLSTLASGVVGAPGFIVDVFEEITGVEADIDSIDYLDELSEDLSKKAEELNNQQRAYKDDFIGSISEGNILDAVNIGFNTVANSAPIMVAAGLTGGAGGVAGALTSAATMSAIMIPAEYASTKISEDEKIKELSDGDKLTRAFFRGGAEGVFEGLMGPVGSRSFSLFKDGVKNLVKTTAKEGGVEAAKEVAEGMGKKTALEVFKTFGISTAGEAGSEALTALSQDLTDDYLGIQNLSVEEYMRNAAEAGALGVFMGGVTTGALGGAGQVMSYLPLRNQKVYQGAKTEVREKQESGEINNEEAKQMDDAIESAKVALDKTDPSLSEENQERVAKLIDERERIKIEIEGLDDNQVPVQNKKNRIDEINKEISEIGIEKQSTEEETLSEKPLEEKKVGTGMFSTKTTGLTSIDDVVFSDKDMKGYHKYYKGKESEVIMMSPDEYLKRVRDGFGTDIDENILEESQAKIQAGIDSGDKIDMPYIEYDEDGKMVGQEGRNRATLAKSRGETLIPVVIQKRLSFDDKVSDARNEIADAVKSGAKDVNSIYDFIKDKYGLHRDKRAFIDRNVDIEKAIVINSKTEQLSKKKKDGAETTPEEPVSVETAPAEVEKLRAEEQAEMLEQIPGAENALTDGKVDREKITTEEGKAKFDEIYSKYDEKISPLLEAAPIKETEPSIYLESTETGGKINVNLAGEQIASADVSEVEDKVVIDNIFVDKERFLSQSRKLPKEKRITPSKEISSKIRSEYEGKSYSFKKELEDVNTGDLIETEYEIPYTIKVGVPVTGEGASLSKSVINEISNFNESQLNKTTGEALKELEELKSGKTRLKNSFRIYKGLGGKRDLSGARINAHKDVNGIFSSSELDVAKDYSRGKGILEVVIKPSATVEVVNIDPKGKKIKEYREAEVEAINESNADIVKLITRDGKIRRGKPKEQVQYVIKNQDILTDSVLSKKLEELAEAKEKPKTNRRGKTQVQKAIDEFVDKKIPSTEKVSMSEKQALNKQIRDFARGVREAYKDQANFKKKVNKLISDNFKLFGDLTPSKVIALTRRALDISSSKPKSLDKFIDYAAKLEQMTEDNVRKDILKRVIRDTAPDKLKNRVGGILKGKIKNYEGKVLSSIRNAIKEDSVESLQSTIDELENKQEQGIKLSEKEIFLLQVAKISDNLLSGDLKKTLEAEAKIKELIKDGKSKYREDIQKRATEYERLVIESLPAITGGKKLTDQFGKLEQGAKRRPLTEAIREKLAGFLDYGEGLRTLLDKIDRTAQRDESGYGGVIDKELYEPVADGRREKDSLDTSKINELSDKLTKLYGKKKKKALRDNQRPKKLGAFTDRKGNEVKLFLSQNQAYPLYQYMQDPSNMSTFEAMGFTDEMLQAVEDFLTPEIKEWADWQMSEFFPKYYDQINAVYKDMNDIDLPKQKIYVPIIRNLEGFNEKEVGVDEITFGNPQSTYKSLKQRQSSKAPFDMTKDGNEKLMEYIEGMNRYIAFAKPVKRLNVVFKNKDVRNAIREFNSTETLKAIDGFIERIANNSSNLGQRIALLDKIRGNVTIASLALAPTVTIKQLTSIPAYAADIPISKFISGLGAFAKNPKKVADILMESEYMQKRYKDGFERDILDGMKRDYDSMLKGTSNLKNKMMFLIKWGDKGAILMGGYSVYKYHFDKSRAEGKSIGESKKIALSKFEEATKLSQQSTNPEDLSQFQSMGSIGKLFTMYMTSPIAYFRQERKSARDFVKGYKFKDKKLMRNAVKRFTIYHFVLPLVFQYVASGLPGLLTDWDEEDEKDLMRAASIGSLNGVFIAGQLISYFGDILTDKAWVRGGKFSPSPAFDAIVNIMNQSEDVIAEWNKNPNKFSDDLMKEMIDLGFSVDVAVGLPVNRVKKLIENWKTIADDNDLETREEIALGLGFSPYVVTPKKKSKTTEGRTKKSTRKAKESTRQSK